LTDIQTIQDQIRARLAEVQKLLEPLRLEAEQLTKMVATFDAQRASAAPRSSTRKAAPRRAAAKPGGGAKRGRPLGSGNRAQQAVAKIVEQPGITASELAKSMGISPNYLYRVLPRLEKEAKVTKQGRGYHPAGDTADSATTNGQPVSA
jgi:DNA invertase Pin-like site-specific DNA recombinase